MSQFNAQNPWMKEREAILCGWKPDYNRGKFNNMNMNLSVDWYSFSNRQLRDYARMLRACGFTGVQITDNCGHWRWYNNYEVCHDKIRVFADALHAEGMKVTLWVWAANFHGHGWVDDTVRYEAKDGGSAYDDPDVFATFNKYYDIYADCADITDRLALHFFDPGNLKDPDDIIRFAKLIYEKFRAVNPAVEMGIDTWSCPADFPQRLIEGGFDSVMLMETNSWPRDRRRAFRQGVRDLGLKLGVWSWYLADMEIDQSAWMVVNARVEKEVYNRIRRDADDILVPGYWSEMDSYHVMNLFSLYSAGQLLINPDDDPDRLVREIAYKVFGEKYGDAAERALQFIQDGRDGTTWDAYWWPTPPRYKPLWNPEEMARRGRAVLAEWETVAKDRSLQTDFPLPIAPSLLAELMLPHIEQITRFAEFHVDFAKLEAQAESGAPKDFIAAELDRIWDPIPDFNAIIGCWGQREARAQAGTVYSFCKSLGIKMPHKPLFYYQAKKRYYEYFVSEAKVAGSPVKRRHDYEGSMPYYMIEDEILNDLEAEGLLVQLPGDRIMLTEFDAYKYR